MNGATDDTRLEEVGRLTPAQVAAVIALVGGAADADGVVPLSEHVLLHLRYGSDEPARNLLVWHNGSQLAAYAHLDVTDPVDGPSAEMVVAPSLRRRGLGRTLIDALLAQAGGPLRLWAHGGLAEASVMAEHLGFRRVRVLLQLRRSLLAPLPVLQLPDGISVRTFVPGVDDEPWLALNARAFADHPEQGAWTVNDLNQRIREEWFNPAGFFLAERDGELIGFHWTKVHGQQPTGHDHGHIPIGEVYVVGIDPSAQRIGLGHQLTVVGLRYLRTLGLGQVMLYVEESNTGAIKLYESLGFSRWDVDVLFRHD